MNIQLTNSDKHWRAARRQLDPIQQCIQLADDSKNHLKNCLETADMLNREMIDQKKKMKQIEMALHIVVIPNTTAKFSPRKEGYIHTNQQFHV